MDPGRLDPQQVLERQGVAPFLQRQHHLARIEQHDMVGKVVDRVTRDRFGDDAIGFAHRDIADDDEARSRLFRQRLEPFGAHPGAQHDDAALEALAAQHLAEQQPQREQRDHRRQHRVEQVGPPEGERRDQKEDHRLKNRAERHRDQQPRGGDAQRLQRVRAINADRNHRQFQADRERRHLRQPGVDRLDAHADLMRAIQPAELRRAGKQHDVEQRQQHHRIGNIMFEQTDHDALAPNQPISIGCV